MSGVGLGRPDGVAFDDDSRQGAGAAASRSDGFRPDLEGLRAVAVGLVLLFHADIPPFAGGYVGVDVFFVLSGFLITGLLVRELGSTGRISFAAFYARRARRLLPAAALVLFATAIGSVILLPPLRVPDVAADIASAAAYASNLRFAFQSTDYLQSDMPPSPVLHFWSLGVEEQFYLFWPALLALTAGAAYLARNREHGARLVTLTLAVVFIASLALAIWLTGVQQPWAFFSLPARAWELALGGLLAMPLAARLGEVHLGATRLAPSIGWLGLAAVAVSGVLVTASTPFPGVAALLPTVGSAMVILSGLGPTSGPTRSTASGAGSIVRGGPAAVLSLAPLRSIGRISYSLYLWHWPVLVLPAVAFGNLSAPVRIGLVGLSVGVAAASQRWVENPIRRGRFVGTRPSRVLAYAGALSLTVAVSAIALGQWSENGLRPTGPAISGSDDLGLPPIGSPPSPGPASSPIPPILVPPNLPALPAMPVPRNLLPALADARNDLPVIYSDGCHADPPTTAPPAASNCTFGELTASRTVVLFGDSHAAQWFPAIERLATEQHWRLLSLTKSACASADVAVWSQLFNRSYDECATWREHAFDLIARVHPTMVVVSNDRGYTLAIDGAMAWTQDHEDLWAAGLASTVHRLATTGAEVVVIGDTVRQDSDPLDCLSGHFANASACSTPYRDATDGVHALAEWQAVTASGETYIDPRSWMCDTDPCPSILGRFLVYRDTHHMTATFARALGPRLFALLPALP